MLTFIHRAVVAALLALNASAAFAADEWLNLATVSMTDATTPKLSNRSICYSDGVDIACDNTSAFIQTGGLINAVQVQASGYVSAGTLITSGTSYAGQVSATNISATLVDVTRNGTVSGTYGYFNFISGTAINGTFTGDGSGLIGVTAASSDRITSGTTIVYANQASGYVSFTSGGTTTGFYSPGGIFGAVGISTTSAATNQVSFTTGYFSGNVGIGANAPARTLDVAWTGNAGGLRLVRSDVVGTTLDFVSSGSGTPWIIQPGSTKDLSFVLGGVERLRFTAAGTVGIGMAAPAATLQVSGTFTVSNSAQTTTPSLYVGASGFVGVGTNSPASALSLGAGQIAGPDGTAGAPTYSFSSDLDTGFYSSAANIIALATGGVQRFFISTNFSANSASGPQIANTSANTSTTPVLIPNRADPATGFAAGAQGNINAIISGTEVMRWTPTGIGISTSTPNAKLDVHGTISATSFVGNGSGLTGVTAASSDRISSGTTIVYANQASGYVSFTSGGTTTGFYSPGGIFGAVGISTTTNASNMVSFTTGYFSGNVGIGATANTNYAANISGSINLPIQTSGVPWAVYSGGSRLIHLYAPTGAFGRNTFVGNNSGNFTMGAGANYNTGLGTFTLSQLTTGANNTAIGPFTLTENTTGSGNTGVGFGALHEMNMGGNNVAIGVSALFHNISASQNVVIGNNAAYGATSETAVSESVVIGYNAGSALRNGFRNVLIGQSSGVATTYGTSNTYLGFQAGNLNTTGSNNVMLGTSTNATVVTDSYKLNIGNTLYGDLLSKSISTTNISLTGIIQVASVSTPACAAGIVGGLRYTNVSDTLQICTSVGWKSLPSSTTAGGADNLGNHTATQALNVAGFDITNVGAITATTVSTSAGGTVSATLLNALTASLTNVFAAGTVTITTINNIGSFSGNSLSVNSVSSTLVSATNVSGTLIQVGTGNGASCDAARKGSLRYSNTSSTVEYCNSSAWKSLGPSDTTPISFSVHKNGTNQTVTGNTITQVTWSTEAFDTNNNFVSNRFTPTIAGKYLLSASTNCSSAASYCQIYIYKNGSGITTTYSPGNLASAATSVIVDMNGSTDYAEVYARMDTSPIGGAQSSTYFNGVILGPQAGGSGGATAAGSTADVQYNSGGALAADTGNFTYASGLLKAPTISATTISATFLYGQYASVTTIFNAGSLSGNTIAANSVSSTLVSATNISGTLIQVGTGNGASCDASRKGAIRYSNTSSTVEYCNSSAWTSLGPSDTTPISFSASSSSAQAIGATTWTKLSLGTETFDTNNNFDSATNYRFQPTIGGNYLFVGQVSCASTAMCLSAIYKNGVEFARGSQIRTTAGGGYISNFSFIMSMNGTSDYVELYDYSDNATTMTGTFSGSILGPQSGSGGATTAGSTADVQYNSGGALAADTGNFTYASGLLKAPAISATTISGTYHYGQYASLTTILNTGSFSGNIIAANSVSSTLVSATNISGTLIQVGAGNGASCDAARKGSLRYSNTSSTVEYCNSATWISMGPSATTPVGFLAQKTSNQGTSGATKITFTNEIYDSNGDYDTSTSRFTASIAGLYLVMVEIDCDSGPTNACAPGIRKNGSNYFASQGPVGSGYIGAGVSGVLYLSAGDYLEVYSVTGSGNVRGISTQSFFSATLIGPQASGSTTPAGSTADIQFNSGGNLAADTGNFTYASSVLKAPTVSATTVSATNVSATNLTLSAPANSAGSHPVCWNSTTRSVSYATSCTASDAGLKTDVRPLPSSLEKIVRLKGVSFSWKNTERGGAPQIGLIAQDVEKVYPELVTVGDDGLRNVDYAKLAAPLIEAVKTLKASNDNLISETIWLRGQLKAANDNFDRRLRELESRANRQ